MLSTGPDLQAICPDETGRSEAWGKHGRYFGAGNVFWCNTYVKAAIFVMHSSMFPLCFDYSVNIQSLVNAYLFGHGELLVECVDFVPGVPRSSVRQVQMDQKSSSTKLSARALRAMVNFSCQLQMAAVRGHFLFDALELRALYIVPV